MEKKIAASATFLTIGVIVGVVVLVNRDGDFGSNKKSSVNAVVKTGLFGFDFDFLGGNNNNNNNNNNVDRSSNSSSSAALKDNAMSTVGGIAAEIKKSFDAAGSLKLNIDASVDPRDHMAVSNCETLLTYATDEVQQSYHIFTNLQNIDKIGDHVHDLLTWLSAVYARQMLCLEQIENPQYKNAMTDGLADTIQLTSTALNIVVRFSQAINTFTSAFHVDPKFGNRRLLQTMEVNEDGFPTWLSVKQRKLLDSQENTAAHATVAKDGSGQYSSIKQALDAYPQNLADGKYVIHVKAGTYNEQVNVKRNQKNVFMYGDGPTKTIITGKRSSAIDKLTTLESATFSVLGNGFIAKSMGIQNTAGPEGAQAVALLVDADMVAVINCRIEGYQDTLFYATQRQFYRDCYISGTIDFIFGMGAALIQNSQIVVRKPSHGQWNVLTADGTADPNQVTGLVIQNCRVTGEQGFMAIASDVNTFLGRPWKSYATTVFMETDLGNFIQPQGWLQMSKTNHHQTCNYVEYGNRGASADTSRRVKWNSLHVVHNPNDVAKYTAARFIDQKAWLEDRGVAFVPRLTQQNS